MICFSGHGERGRERGQFGEKRGEENESDDALSKTGVDTLKKKVAEGGGGGRNFKDLNSPSENERKKNAQQRSFRP